MDKVTQALQPLFLMMRMRMTSGTKLQRVDKICQGRQEELPTKDM